MDEPEVFVALDRTLVPIEREVFVGLFTNSVVSGYAGVRHALEGRPMPMSELLKLSRQAEIPYPLFFAPREVVEAQIRLKTEKLKAGFTKKSFSMHSRHKVSLHDVELIIKDLMRKQEWLRRHDPTLTPNAVIGLLKKSRRSIEEDAELLCKTVAITRAEIRSARTKEAALELLIARLEACQVLVSRSAQHYMPQEMPAQAKFSGMTIKDKRVPFIFLATGNEGEHLEPAGRKLFTLVLLTTLIARDTFAPVNYDGHTKEESAPRAYRIAAEVLMPAAEVRPLRFPDLDAIKYAAEAFKVTPSAMAMRARQVGRLDKVRFQNFMNALEAEYQARPKSVMTSPLPVNALRKYNGAECSRRMLGILDAGNISPNEFRRVMFFNKLPKSSIARYREAVG